MMALRNVRGFDGVSVQHAACVSRPRGEGQQDLLGADAEIAEVRASGEQNAEGEDLEQARIGKCASASA